jgi:serine/threonine protein phosphatase PrpC
VLREADGDVPKASQALVAEANARGGEDNITVLLLHFKK